MRVTDALLPRISQGFDVGIAKAAAVVTGFSVAYGLMQMVFGPLGDRYGKLRVVGISSGAAALASLACFLVHGFDALLAARLIAGAFCGAIIPLSMAWIGDVVPYERRQPVLAKFLLGQILGLAGGSAVGGFAAESAHWRWPFAALAMWLAVSAATISMSARHDPTPRGRSDTGFVRDVLAIASDRWARTVVLSVFTEGMVLFGALAFIPTHLHFRRGVDLSTAGLALVAYAMGGVVFAIFAGRFVRTLGEVRLARWGTGFLTVGYLVIAMAPGAATAALGCLVAGLGFYAFHNTLQTNATQMAPQRRGASMALFASLFFLGQSAGVAIAGVLVEHAGTTAVVAGAGLAMIPVGLTFASLREARAARGSR